MLYILVVSEWACVHKHRIKGTFYYGLLCICFLPLCAAVQSNETPEVQVSSYTFYRLVRKTACARVCMITCVWWAQGHLGVKRCVDATESSQGGDRLTDTDWHSAYYVPHTIYTLWKKLFLHLRQVQNLTSGLHRRIIQLDVEKKRMHWNKRGMLVKNSVFTDMWWKKVDFFFNYSHSGLAIMAQYFLQGNRVTGSPIPG